MSRLAWEAVQTPGQGGGGLPSRIFGRTGRRGVGSEGGRGPGPPPPRLLHPIRAWGWDAVVRRHVRGRDAPPGPRPRPHHRHRPRGAPVPGSQKNTPLFCNGPEILIIPQKYFFGFLLHFFSFLFRSRFPNRPCYRMPPHFPHFRIFRSCCFRWSHFRVDECPFHRVPTPGLPRRRSAAPLIPRTSCGSSSFSHSDRWT